MDRSAPHSAQGGSKIVLLAGGTGGAKLARGMLDVVGPDELVVIANTADDIDIYGVRVSPDPDLVSFWLADLIDERGWGLSGDTFEVMDALRELGVDVWFNLGDRDLAWCMERQRMLDEGLTATEALGELNRRVGLTAQVLPMCDGPLRTIVNGVGLQEFLILNGGRGPVRDVNFTSPEDSGDDISPTPQVLAALRDARAVIIGPSNPVISIWPILSVIGEVLLAGPAPVVAVSPIVKGQVLKGPTDAFMDALRLPASASGVVAYYESLYAGLLDGVVADEPVPVGPPARSAGEKRFAFKVAVSEDPAFTSAGPEVAAPREVPSGLATLQIDTAMPDQASRVRVAEQTLRFAQSLAG
ncbi:MAG TPA: 2-phospho-L-lactate transferase CofD family protein [Solirubrobacteraceae bacterium]